MKRFDLFFPTKEQHNFNAEQVAYVCVVNPYNSATFVRPPEGIPLITTESTSADECVRLIDGLIEELKELKTKARRKFKR